MEPIKLIHNLDRNNIYRINGGNPELDRVLQTGETQIMSSVIKIRDILLSKCNEGTHKAQIEVDSIVRRLERIKRDILELIDKLEKGPLFF